MNAGSLKWPRATTKVGASIGPINAEFHSSRPAPAPYARRAPRGLRAAQGVRFSTVGCKHFVCTALAARLHAET
jgi:hypothetical protein